jgi:hypothetical protein
MKRTLQIGIALALMAVTVQADIFGFETITTNSPNREAIADQLFMDANTLSATSSSLAFTNAGPSDSSIAAIYFGSDLTTLNLTIDSVIACSPGVSFDIGSNPGNPPGFEEFANWWSITIASADAEPPPSHNGINPYECLELGMSYTSGSTLSELIQTGELQVALHVIDIGEYSDTFVNDTTVIPEPASLILMGSVGSLLGFVRKRFAV